MSVVLTGTASERVRGAAGFIDVVTDPSQFIGRMPFDNAVVGGSNADKTLKELLEDKGNPVYLTKKDGTKQLQEYYKADYELKLTDYISSRKSEFNRIISREEALTQMIDKEYPDMPIEQKLELASLDDHASINKIKKLWKVGENKPVMREAAKAKDNLIYPQLAEGGVEEQVLPKMQAASVQEALFREPPIFRRQQGMTLTTNIGDQPIINIIDTPYCVIATSASLFQLTQNNKYLLNTNNKNVEVIYSGLSFFDPSTGVAYTILLK